ncbi:MAG TPA: trypsin-like peptidase domain-containing protein [Terriglobia bacterium]|jgi:serine protease Do
MKHLMALVAASIVFSMTTESRLEAQSRSRAAQSLAELSDSLRDLSASVSLSVVQVTASGYGIDSDEQHAGVSIFARQRSTGSGIIVSDDGYIMTNAHVVDTARAIRVKLNGQRSAQSSVFDAKLIGMDSALDLALLKVDAQGLKPLPLGSSMDVKQGQIVLAFGSPLGMENSVSMGVVSAVSRQLSEDDPRIFIQTDTPINPGNSGGPLVDVNGRVIGINTFIFSQSGGSEGIGFAIPSNVARYAYTSLRRDGHVHRGQLGINARTITPALAIAFNLNPDNGVLVEDVLPDGPADKAKVHVGDVILSINDMPLHTVRDLSLMLYEFVIGNTITLQVQRDGKKLPIDVTVTEKQNDPVRFADLVSPDKNLITALAILGVTIDAKIRDLLPLRIDKGVLVAAFAGPPLYFGDQLHQGDVIHAVNGHSVSSVEELRTQLNNVKHSQPIVLQVERNASLSFLVMEGN